MQSLCTSRTFCVKFVHFAEVEVEGKTVSILPQNRKKSVLLPFGHFASLWGGASSQIGLSFNILMRKIAEYRKVTVEFMLVHTTQLAY